MAAVKRISAAVLAAALSVGGWGAGAQEVAPLSAQQISEARKPSREGRAALIGAFKLTAKSQRFGGISGLRVAGDDLVAVSDRGHWVRFALRRDRRGRLVGVGPSVRIEPIRDAGRGRLRGSSGDAEDLTVERSGRIWLSFERGHRIVAYDRLGGAAKAEASQLPIRGLASNGGVEGLAAAADRALIAVIEEPVRANGRPDGTPADAIIGWRLIGGRATPFWIPRVDGFAATGADIGPDGALYLLERRYSLWTGVRMRIRRFEPRRMRALSQHRAPRAFGLGAGRAIATLGPLGPVDNMEALSVEPRPGGGLWLFVMSDDNFSARQRTLLLQYAWPPLER